MNNFAVNCRTRVHIFNKFLKPSFQTVKLNSKTLTSAASPSLIGKQGIVKDPHHVSEDDMKLDMELIHHLERTSLVDFDNDEALKRLEEAVRFANTLFEVDTNGVEPLTSVLEDQTLHLRDDVVATTNRQEILANAVVTEEDYFVAPPGNIPLEPQNKSNS